MHSTQICYRISLYLVQNKVTLTSLIYYEKNNDTYYSLIGSINSVTCTIVQQYAISLFLERTCLVY